MLYVAVHILKSDVLPSGVLFPGTELMPLLPYLRAGLLKRGWGNVSMLPVTWTPATNLYLFILGFTSLSTLYRSYHDG